MTLSEYLDQDLPFYHITHIEKKESILKTGLSRRRNPQGICVIRSSDLRIIKLIAIGQIRRLINQSDRFCIFKIVPSKHSILFKDVRFDITGEFTNPIHNYIRKDLIYLNSDDIYKEDIYIPDSSIPDFSFVQTKLLSEGLIVELEYR